MKRVSEARETIVRVEIVVEPVEVEVPPLIVEDEVRHVQVAKRVLPLLYKIPSRPLSFEFSRDCILFGTLKSPLIFCTKYLHFLEMNTDADRKRTRCHSANIHSGIRRFEAVAANFLSTILCKGNNLF